MYTVRHQDLKTFIPISELKLWVPGFCSDDQVGSRLTTILCCSLSPSWSQKLTFPWVESNFRDIGGKNWHSISWRQPVANFLRKLVTKVSITLVNGKLPWIFYDNILPQVPPTFWNLVTTSSQQLQKLKVDRLSSSWSHLKYTNFLIRISDYQSA